MTDITPNPVPLIDDPHAPEVFATVATGFLLLNGNISITFESARSDYSTGIINRVVMARLVMPIPGAQGLVAGLNDYLERQGLSPSQAIVGEMTPQ